MQLIRKYNKGIRYLLCAIDLLSKYTFVVPLKDKKGTTIVNAFQSILGSSKRKPNKIWVDQGSEFYSNYFKKGKSEVAERFIRTLKNKIYKLMTTISFDEYNEESNGKDSKYKLGNHVRI